MSSIVTSSFRMLPNHCCAPPVPRDREATLLDVELVASDHVRFVVHAGALYDACPALRGRKGQHMTFYDEEVEDSHTLHAFLVFLRFRSLDGLWDAHDVRDHWTHLAKLVEFMRRYAGERCLDALGACFSERLEAEPNLPTNHVVLAFLVGAALGNVDLCQAAIHRSWLPPANGLGLSLGDNDEAAQETLVPGFMPPATDQLIPVVYRWALRRSWDKASSNRYWWGAFFSGMVLKATKRVFRVDGVHLFAASPVLRDAKLCVNTGPRLMGLTDASLKRGDTIAAFLGLVVNSQLPSEWLSIPPIELCKALVDLATLLDKWQCAAGTRMLVASFQASFLFPHAPRNFALEAFVLASTLDDPKLAMVAVATQATVKEEDHACPWEANPLIRDFPYGSFPCGCGSFLDTQSFWYDSAHVHPGTSWIEVALEPKGIPLAAMPLICRGYYWAVCSSYDQAGTDKSKWAHLFSVALHQARSASKKERS
ncbi:hypothetical protein Q8F55_002712 [Vanrija albida]|uniref:BTB domain-containing protein n=1 Tax=Vanrija albida TaxID=181172 RepID=A0ABR3QAK7_9TREE